MIYEHTSYRTYLKEALADKAAKNPRYSLRAMAQQLGCSHSMLSQVMKGVANLSLEAARKVAAKLELAATETEYLCLLVQLETTEDIQVRESILQRLKSLNPRRTETHDLSVDVFKQRSEWYYSAILALAEINGFELTANHISKRLRITKIEAEVALDRLLRLELLEKNDKGKLVLTHEKIVFQSDASANEALRKFYRQMLQKASSALDTQKAKERVSGFETFSISGNDIENAREITEKYFQDMLLLGKKSSGKRDVYHLLVHFFNLTSRE